MDSSPILTLDLNCDMGESFGHYSMGNDAAIMPYISSANIACGFHAGDPDTMAKTVRLALEHNVAIGAHPGLPDLAGFGRRNMSVTDDEVRHMMLYQMGALDAFVKAEGGQLHHVKPHGALYNMAVQDNHLARAIAEAVYSYNPELVLYGLANSALIEEGNKSGLITAQEVFADRTYQANGLLTQRGKAGAIIEDTSQALAQVHQMVAEGKVTTLDGQVRALKADTLCIHGDGLKAVEFVQVCQLFLERNSITVQPIKSLPPEPPVL